VKCIQRMPDDECLILGSDGLWDVVTNEHACEIARECLRVLRKKYKARPSPPGEDPAASGVAALLVKLAYRRGSKDNISVVVVDLKCRPRG
jgi:protein phosphatase 2C